ncbi:hypothetical protein KIN20_016081 [Parelaphostrongylus tenuis]|uniref:Mid2 domain-containing protein n=1 Tax=Parelaphostrongylus tenuis TaxID=148309 RepID=A0AAD5MZD0_PARTN|nr:hypothetical protein KIN20_016081 [Parelaphostrongylus tenuis]
MKCTSAVQLLLLTLVIAAHTDNDTEKIVLLLGIYSEPSRINTSDTFGLGTSDTANATTVLTSQLGTKISITSIPFTTPDKEHTNIYEWRTIVIRVGIGGACALGFIFLFAFLYFCFRSGSNKRRSKRRRKIHSSEVLECGDEDQVNTPVEGSVATRTSTNCSVSMPLAANTSSSQSPDTL